MGLGAVNPTRVGIAVWPWAAYLGAEGVKHGIRAKISSLTRMSVRASMVRGKITGQYVNSILAKREVQAAGYDEAILLDQDGLIAEGSGENIFMVKNGVLVTPSLSSPILAGITRASILTLAHDSGIPCEERAFTRDELYVAEEAFFTGTAAEITPIREVDGRTVGTGKPGALTRAFQDQYRKVSRAEVGDHRDWLALVE
jgi:branched-chain amino acid aminotransferase